MRISFDDFLFDQERRELSRSGVTVHLSPKGFRLLELLLTAAPAAVSREALYRELWGDAFVEEINLSNLISEIRSSLGDTARDSRYIKTVHRFGYRFNAPLRTSSRAERPRFYIDWQSTEHPLREGANVVGRDRDAEVRIEVAGVSRRHAVITIADESATIEDLGSKNGTFVCGQRIAGAASLRAGDSISLGSVSMTLRRNTDVDSTMTELPSMKYS